MILLLVGVVCFVAALHVTREGAAGARRDVRGAGAAAWMGLVALLALVQLGAGRGSLDGYRLTLLGFRFDASTHRADGPGLVVSGDYDTADLWVPGAGDRPVARLFGDGETELRAVPLEDGAAVALAEEPGLLGTTWRVLGGVPFGPGDTVTIRARDRTWRLVPSTRPDTVALGPWAVAVPWVREHVVRDVSDAPGGAGGSVRLPGVERGVLAALRPYHPSVFQRTYPLSDILAGLDPEAGAGLPALSSFLYYRDGTLHLADLDADVEMEDRAAAMAPADRAGQLPTGRRLLVAALPLRDFPEPDLVLPERYGVRPLRSFRLDRSGDWVDAKLSSPEVRALDREALAELRLPESRTATGRRVYRIRLAPARDALARQAVVFDASPARFAVPGQAVLSLPEEPTEGTLDVLTPAGLAGWETGRPLALGTGDRRLVVRIDGQGTSAGFWWIHGILLGLPVLLFLLRPMTGPVFALALTAAGLATFRAVLSLSAMARPPHVMEAQQLGLWLLPFLPWAVVVAGEVGRGAGAGTPARRTGAGFHVAYAFVLVGLAAVLFPGAGVKAAVLAVLALGIAGLAWVARRASSPAGGWSPRWWKTGWDALLGWVERVRSGDSRVRGWTLGLGFLFLRAVLEALGFREQLTVAGTRIGMSVLYTPLVVLGLALVLARVGRALDEARGTEGFPRAVAWASLDLGAFLLAALVAVSAWISDFGIALALLPGALALAALLGARWAPGGRRGALTVVSLALPLVLFGLVQVAPPLLRFAWGGDLQAVDARLGEWNRNELLLLERGDPAGLRLIGQRRSEALAVMRETMRSYTRGNLGGKGYLEGRVSEAVAETATREHAVSALLASQFGLAGSVGLLLLLLALFPPSLDLLMARGRSDVDRGAGMRVAGSVGLALAVLVPAAFLLPSPWNTLFVGLVAIAVAVGLAAPAFGGRGLWGVADEVPPGEGRGTERSGSDVVPFRRIVAAAAVLTVGLAGVYMVMANYGLVFFTGKNVYLLGLDSLGDALEAALLLGVAAAALGAEARVGSASEPDGRGTGLEPVGAVWWHPSDSGRGGWDEQDDGVGGAGGDSWPTNGGERR